MAETVQVILINEDGNILCVSRKHDHNDFGLPGGKLESFDKTPMMGAIRETKEETGIDIFNLRLVLSMHLHGHQGYTYVADYKGEINYDFEKEPHVVKWAPYNVLLEGTFHEWNEIALRSLLSMGYKFNLT